MATRAFRPGVDAGHCRRDPTETTRATGQEGGGLMATARKPKYITNTRGEQISCQHNALIWLDKRGLAPHIILDAFRQSILVTGEPLTDEIIVDLVRQMEADTLIHWSEAHVRSALLSLASRQASSSLKDWLESLIWDHVPRIDTFFAKTYQAESSPYTAACGRVLFISAVARAYRPGCKADVMVVLIGDQGLGKSKGIEELVPEQSWYSDDLGGDLYDRKAAEGLQSKWIIEFGEFARINRATLDVVKAFLSRRVDHYRPAYGRLAKDFPRQCIFVGTTNSHQPLQDLENRRFMPVRCYGYSDNIPEKRNQLWAEAVHRYKADEPWWITDAELLSIVKERQADARQHDEWEEILRPKLMTKVTITMAETADLLGVKLDRLDKPTQTRIGIAMQALGWERKRVRNGDARSYVYERKP
jgi:putative DNA primase/helicase